MCRNNWIIITVLMLITITALSLYPLSNLPPVPGGDKFHHFIAYAALFFPVALQKAKYWIVIGLAFIFWSAGIEVVQSQVGRTLDWLDMFYNISGLLCGFSIAQLINWFVPENFDKGME